jgi:hypothetical protein
MLPCPEAEIDGYGPECNAATLSTSANADVDDDGSDVDSPLSLAVSNQVEGRAGIAGAGVGSADCLFSAVHDIGSAGLIPASTRSSGGRSQAILSSCRVTKNIQNAFK